MQSLHSRPYLLENRDFLWDMAAWSLIHSEDNSDQMTRLRCNLVRVREQELTPRQREVLRLYYDENKSVTDIAAQLQVNKSTVSRTIARGKNRLYRYLKYSF